MVEIYIPYFLLQFLAFSFFSFVIFSILPNRKRKLYVTANLACNYVQENAYVYHLFGMLI